MHTADQTPPLNESQKHVPVPKIPFHDPKGYSTPKTSAPKNKYNQFQFNLYDLEKALVNQVGATGRAPMGALNGHWGGQSDYFGFEIIDVGNKGSFVARARCDDGLILDLTPGFLMDWRVLMLWNAIDAATVKSFEKDLGDHCEHGSERAKNIATKYIEIQESDVEAYGLVWYCIGDERPKHGKELHNEGLSKALLTKTDFTQEEWNSFKVGHITFDCFIESGGLYFRPGAGHIITLDGKGNNRRGIVKAYADKGLPCPRIIVCECDPVVALIQRILYGEDVIYTGGDVATRTKKAAGRTPTMEDIVLNNRLPHALKKGLSLSQIGLVYCDYCTSPNGNMLDVCGRFLNLTHYGGTISTRQHPNVNETFEEYIPMLDGYENEPTPNKNRRVVCKMFTRTNDRREVKIPGYFWNACPRKYKFKKFRGFMVDDGYAFVETERGVEKVFLDRKCVKRFLVKKPRT